MKKIPRLPSWEISEENSLFLKAKNENGEKVVESLKEKLPVISTANAENDDWMQKSNPQAYKEELEIHDRLAEKYKERE